MSSPIVTSEHVFLSILSDVDENNKIKKIFNKAGITYNILKTKILSDDIGSKMESIFENHD